jgi:hypothetical protein
MNYYIEKHDMEIILDALEVLHTKMKNAKLFGLIKEYPYDTEDVDSLLQTFDNNLQESDK